MQKLRSLPFTSFFRKKYVSDIDLLSIPFFPVSVCSVCQNCNTALLTNILKTGQIWKIWFTLHKFRSSLSQWNRLLLEVPMVGSFLCSHDDVGGDGLIAMMKMETMLVRMLLKVMVVRTLMKLILVRMLMKMMQKAVPS